MKMNKFIKERNHMLRTMARIERKYNADLFMARIKKTMRRSLMLKGTNIMIIVHLHKNDSFLIYHTMREAFLSHGYKADYYVVNCFDLHRFGVNFHRASYDILLDFAKLEAQGHE